MIVFKNYFRILKSNKNVIIMYIIILLLFTSFSTKSSNPSEQFKASKPDILIINKDSKSLIVDNFKNYIKNNANISNIKTTKTAIDDALFYQDVDAVIYIYKGYTKDYLNNKEKKLDIKLGTDANASYAKMLIERYFKIADITNNNINDTSNIINTINYSLSTNSTIKLDSKVDTDSLDIASYYYSFANYSMLAVCIFIIAIVMNTFNKENIKKRNIVSSKGITQITKQLYLGNFVFAVLVWLFVVIASFFIVGDIMFTLNGLCLIINSFFFMTVALGIGFLIGNILKSKNAINGIMNIIALGSSFLCGCFIPISFLPDSVIKFSKILPSYWYVTNNNLIKSIEVFNFNSLEPVIINMLIMIIYAVLFFIITSLVVKMKVKDN